MKKKKQRSEAPILEQAVQVLNLPKDLMLGRPLLSAIGSREVFIENFLGIAKISAEEMRIRTKTGFIIILGRQLKIDFYSRDELKISGYILHINYMEE